MSPNYVNRLTRENPVSHEELMHPSRNLDNASAAEVYQWAVEHWYNYDVAVLDDVEYSQSGKPYFIFVMEKVYRDKDGDVRMAMSRETISEHELIGIYTYWKRRSDYVQSKGEEND